jgi:hypothetical protein
MTEDTDVKEENGIKVASCGATFEGCWVGERNRLTDIEDDNLSVVVKQNKFLRFVKYASIFAVFFTLTLYLIVELTCDIPYVGHCKGWL